MSSVSTVFFDLDETICRHPRSTGDRLADAFERSGVEPFFDATDFRRWLPEVSADDLLELRTKCFTAIADELGHQQSDARAVARAYEDPDPEAVTFLPGARTALETISEMHDLALVTNGGRETQTAKLNALSIRDHFDAVTFAESGRPVKPDPEPFHRTLTAMGVSADEVVHIGNSLRSDVAGAQAAGVSAVWLAQSDASGDHVPEYEIESMSDLHEPPWV